MKGIVLAGGNATRLYPLTIHTSKQLLPVYRYPMIFYPLNTLINCGIRDILIIISAEHKDQFHKLFRRVFDNGEVKISFALQAVPRGLADAFRIGESFIGKDNVAMILGDNIFFDDLALHLEDFQKGGLVFAKKVENPSAYGVVEFGSDGRVLSIEEKPILPKSNFCVTGMYVYDNRVVGISRALRPSSRGEIEITDVNRIFLERGELEVSVLGNEWFDAGSYETLLDASNFVRDNNFCENFHPIIKQAICHLNNECKSNARRALLKAI